MQAEIDHSEVRELDQRSGDGFEVTLLWSERTGSVYVSVEDSREGGSFQFAVDPAEALDAFRHPYAYGRTRGRDAVRGAEWGAAAA